MTLNTSGPKLKLDDRSIAEILTGRLNDDSNTGLFGVDCTTGAEYGYGQFKKDVLAMATAFQKENVGDGRVVMIYTDYGSYKDQVAISAGILVGAVVSVIRVHAFTAEELVEIIDESEPAVVFCNTYGVGMKCMSRLLDEITIRPVLKISTVTRERFTEYADIVNSENSFVQPKIPVNKNNPIAILYTNGTTGVRKGVHLSDGAIKSCIANLMSMVEEPLENRFILTSSIVSGIGFAFFMLGIHFGNPRLFFSSNPTGKQVLCSIHMYKPTFSMIGTFRLRSMMCYQLKNDHRYNIESLVAIVATGSILRPKEQNEITKNLLRGRIPIKQFYATTEQGVITHWSMKSDINTVKEGFVGKPAAGVKIKFKNWQMRRSEYRRRNSKSNMIGYFNDVKKTINSYDEDGWYKTGDVGYYTDDCYFYVIGRINECLFYKGQWVCPIDVETVLRRHPDVHDAGVTSRYNSLDGDLLIGVVKVKRGSNVEPHQIVSYVNGRVQDHEKLLGGLMFIESIPRFRSGYIKREELKNLVK